MKGPGKTLCVAMAMLVLAVTAGSVASAQDAGAAKSASAKRGGVAVAITRISQRALLRTNRALVRVRTRRAGKASVALRGRALRRGAKPRRLARSRVIRFRRPGARVVRLTLTPLGRRLVRFCAPRRLIARAVVRSGGKRIGSRRASRPLRRDRPACAGGPGPQEPDPENPRPRPYAGDPIPTENAQRCDWLDPSVCLYPFPNDHFTVADPAADSGRRVNFDIQSMPRNRAGKPVEPQEYNRNDGFSPGAMLITKVPGLDTPAAFAQTEAVPQTDIARYADADQPIVVINARTGERHPIWAELDSNPENTEDVTLIVRPARNFEEGTRYLVALRDLRRADGSVIQPATGFRVYRDRLITQQPEVEERRPEMERIIGELQESGIRRSNLFLAWEFTVASERNLTERMLHIRDDAFAQLGDNDLSDLRVDGDSPAFQIDEVTEMPGDPEIAREVTGSVTVPCYMTANCAPDGATYNYATGPVPPSPDALPQQAGTVDVTFTCLVPRSAVDGPAPAPARPSLYGHGLLGSQGEVGGGNIQAMAAEHGFVFCATDWYGFATTNLPNIAVILQDISRGPLLFDETQQGMLNFLYLGRAMIHPEGFVSDPAFQVGAGDDRPVINTERLFYDGNSQGGILGGSLTAVAPDFNRAVLGVPGMNYSTLLRRSVDFEPYAEGEFGEALCEVLSLPPELCLVNDTPLGLHDNYPDELERPLLFALMQMLWDRAEANGYAHHMTGDPLENTPPHEVLLHVAFGDHQVANVAAEVEARTIGAGVYEPALDPGRHSDVDPFFGIPALPLAPGANPAQNGSALVYWDGGPYDPATRPEGTATPPAANVPPRPEDGYGKDPHSYPRNDPKARLQKSEFLRIGGSLFNPCYSGTPPTAQPTPCYANGYTGP